jgi:hypothetical protein
MNADRQVALRALVEAEMAGLPVEHHDASTGQLDAFRSPPR